MSGIYGKIRLILLIFLIFIGQAPAVSAEPCEMMDMSACDSDMTTSMSDCCDEDCDCPTGHLSAVILHMPLSLEGKIISIQKNSAPLFLVVSQFSSTLYRPPITL